MQRADYARYMTRARRQPADATEDKRLYSNLRHAATSIRKASTALEQPTPKRTRWFRKVAILALSVLGCAWLTMKLQRQQPAAEQTAMSATDAETPEPGGMSAEPIPETEQAAS